MAYNFMQVLFEELEPYSLSEGVTSTDKELGRGSYATVLELDYLGLKCAGKKIHELLIEQEENSMIYAVRMNAKYSAKYATQTLSSFWECSFNKDITFQY